MNDKVILSPVNAGQPLHASSSELIDNPGCYEVREISQGNVYTFVKLAFIEVKTGNEDLLFFSRLQ